MPDTTSTASETDEPDYDRLLRPNLERVFNERKARKRAIAIDELFVAEPVMYEPTKDSRGNNCSTHAPKRKAATRNLPCG
jgi:hypothetical protein